MDQETSNQLIVELASALHTYGVAAHDLEESMTQTSNRLGIDARYFATPTSIFITFGRATEQRTTLLRVSPGEVNLERLCELYSMQRQLLDGLIDAGNCLAEVRRIADAPPRFGGAFMVAAFGLAAGAASTFFGGGWEEVGCSCGLGVLVGCLALLTGQHAHARNLLLPLASLLVSVIAFGVSSIAPVTSGIVIVSSLIILLPGLSVTVAMNELATQNLASGSARIIGAFCQLMIIGFGAAMGRSLSQILFSSMPADVVGPGLPAPVIVGSLLVTAGAFTVLFQARPQDVLWIGVAGFVAYYGARLGVQWLGPLAGASLASTTLGLLSNGVALIRRQPVAVTMVPGLLLLVPGSIGFQSITALLDKDPIRSFESAFSMILISAAIVTGLFVANVLLPPRHYGARKR